MSTSGSFGSGGSQASSPRVGTLVVLPPSAGSDTQELAQPVWHTILSDSHQVVLYNSDSHALSVRPNRVKRPSEPLGSCPYCNRPLDGTAGAPLFGGEDEQRTRAANYFQLLEVANETSSRPSSGGVGRSRLGSGYDTDGSDGHSANSDGQPFRADAMAEGYFHSFFKEEYRLGMGANGSVFLCQHVLDGNPLGHFAVKKIAVGQSHSYLLQILREVRLLEQLRHPNIVTYHHAWLESHQFSSFGPKVPTLFVLMQWAEGGSLDDYIEGRLGRPHHSQGISGPDSDTAASEAIRSRSDRIRAFRAARARPDEERQRRKEERMRGTRTAVHLLSAEETKHLFLDVVSGLAFLHDKSILHLDLKPGNVLLTWDEEALIPRAMLSDFGTSRDMIQTTSSRSGNTGTLEYTAPETLRSPDTGLLTQVDSKADMWSLGMILHMLLFFRLPYRFSSNGEVKSNDGGDMDRLESEVLEYQGFRRNSAMLKIFESRGLPGAYLILLESLLNRLAKKRPTSEQVLRAIKDGNLDPQPRRGDIGEGMLIPRMPSPTYHQPDEDSNRESIDEDTAARFHEEEVAEDGRRPSELELETPYIFDEEKETSPIRLALPSSAYPFPSIAVSSPPLRLSLIIWMNFLRRTGLTHSSLVRGVKSAVLVLKVIKLLSICPEGRPEPITMCFIMGLAISDTWSEDLWITALLSAVHVAILRFPCSNLRCCTL